MTERPDNRYVARPTRRQVLATMAAAGSAALVVGGPGRLAEGRSQGSATPDATPPSDEPIARLAPPDWSFIVYTIADPYKLPETSTLVVPPDTHFVGAEVEIDNASDQPLSFALAQVRLRAADGLEFVPGVAAGPETTIKARVLPPGERARGWLWFNVPDDAELTELVYLAPSPEFSLPLSDVADRATPRP